MNEFDLFDALNGVDDDLLRRTEQITVRKFPLRKLIIAAAAVMALSITVFAAPKLMGLFFGSEITQIRKGIMYTDENGLCFSVDAAYEVDMTLPCAETAPQTIEEYHLPTYFADNGWNCDSSFIWPDDYYSGALYLFSIPGEPQYWVQFRQSPFTLLEPRGRSQFLMNAGRTGIVIEHAVTIGDAEGTLYMVEPSEAEGESGVKNLVWSDGTYAYHILCGYQVTDEMIAGIVESLAPVEDITPYVTEIDTDVPEEKRIPIETFYTLSTIPNEYILEERSWDVNNAYQRWDRNGADRISFSQDRLIDEKNYGPALDISQTLADVMTSMFPYEYETIEENGLLYHIVWQHGDTIVLWQDAEYVYQLGIWGQEVSIDDAFAHIRGIVPMEDFTDHLTE